MHAVRAGFEVIVLGDLNDYSPDPLDAAGNVPKSRVLKILEGTVNPSCGADSKPMFGLGNDSGLGALREPRLRNIMQLIPKDARYTAWYDRDRDGVNDGVARGELSAIDHILVSEALWERVVDVRVENEMSGIEEARLLSDHWPVIVTFGEADGALSGLSALSSSRRCLSLEWVYFILVIAMMLQELLCIRE
jgi:exonuclease III